MAGEDRVWQAILREQGAITVESNRELLDVSLLLSTIDAAKLPTGNRVAIVGFGGGGGVLSADLCARRGLEIPGLSQPTIDRLAALVPPIASVANPIDLTPDMFQPEWLAKFPDALEAIAADPNIDMLFMPLSAMARGALSVAKTILGIPPQHAQNGVRVMDVLASGGSRVCSTMAACMSFDEPSRAIEVMVGKIARHAGIADARISAMRGHRAVRLGEICSAIAQGTVVSGGRVPSNFGRCGIAR